jgi:phosphocarrier protein
MRLRFPAILRPAESRRVARELQVLNHLGIHARPAVQFVRCAKQFRSSIWILARGCRFSAQSIVEVLLAGLGHGAKFVLEAEGSDAEESLRELELLLVRLSEEDPGVEKQQQQQQSVSAPQ